MWIHETLGEDMHEDSQDFGRGFTGIHETLGEDSRIRKTLGEDLQGFMRLWERLW